MISVAYKEQNRILHEIFPTYGTSGHKWVDKALALAELTSAKSVLDYGCGKGTFGKEWKEKSIIRLDEYDPAMKGKDAIPMPSDLVICTDVLEHIELNHLLTVLKDISYLTNKVALVTIATRPAKKKLPDGRNAHLIIKDWEYWRLTLGRYFTVFFVQEDLTEKGEIFAILTPRRL